MNARRQRGLSLIEALVAMAILGLAAVAVVPAFMTQALSNTRNEQRTAAVSAAEQVLEATRLDLPEELPDSGQSASQLVTVGDWAFDVVTRYCEDATYCSQRSRHLRVEVNLDGERIYDVETVFTTFK